MSVSPTSAGTTTVGLTEALLDTIRELVAELHPRRRSFPLTLDSTLDRDIGLDSLARVELLARLERRLDATLPDEALLSAETPRDLLRALRAAIPHRREPPAVVATAPPTGTAGVPDQAQTLLDVLDWHADIEASRVHIRLWQGEHDEDAITYGDLKRNAEAVASGLQQHGVRPGECVAIMLPTGRGYYASFFGVLLAGAIPVPLYPPARPSQIEDHLRRHIAILNNCQATALITVTEAKLVARVLRAQTERLRQVLTVETLLTASGRPARPAVASDDIAFLQYTSGSTGSPKGVVLTHANLLSNIRIMGRLVEASAKDVFVSWLPLYHDMGLIGAWLGSLYFGLMLVNLPPLAFLTRPIRWIEAIHRYRATLTAGPNFAYGLCLRKIDRDALKGIDLSSLRIAFNGAESISPETMMAFCQRFEPFGLQPNAMMPVYGLAECSLGLTFPPLDRGPRVDRVDRDRLMADGRAVPVEEAHGGAIAFVGCGHVLPEHELRIVDEAGKEIGEREEGTLQFRGPSATSGYYRNAVATRALFHNGWLDSGDRAYLANGEVFITGRSKDVIIRAGRNIFPQELEEAIGNLKGIRKGNVAVFAARPPGSDGEQFIVVAETRMDDAEEHESLRRRINDLSVRLAGTVPDDVVLGATRMVLKTSSGKIRRAASRELYETHGLGGAGRTVRWQLLRLVVSGWRPTIARSVRRLTGTIFSVYAYVVFALLGMLVWAGVLSLWKMSWRWHFTAKALRLGAVLCGISVDVQGREHLPSKSTKAVYVANHASYLDVLALIAEFPGQFHFVAKSEFLRSWFLGLFMRRLGTQFVQRFDVRQSVADAERLASAIRAGPPMLYFPEGTFTPVSGLRSFRLGAFMAAADAGVPVVPIAIRGTRSILRDKGWPVRRGRVTLVIGMPVVASEANGDRWARAVKLRDAAREVILRHCGEPDISGELHS